MDAKLIAKTFDMYGTDKGFQHGYNQMYSDVFSKITPVNKLLEIGVKRGRSLAAWCDLFPRAEIVGADIEIREDILSAALSRARIVQGDSTSPTFGVTIGDDYDVIIDDGNHYVDNQWSTFLNLQNNWKKAYVIEDVLGIDSAKILEKRLKSRGFNNYNVYSSKNDKGVFAQSEKAKNEGKEPYKFAFYAIAVYPDPHLM